MDLGCSSPIKVKNVSMLNDTTQGHTNSGSIFSVLVDDDNDTPKETNVGFKTHVASKSVDPKDKEPRIVSLWKSVQQKMQSRDSNDLAASSSKDSVKPKSPFSYTP